MECFIVSPDDVLRGEKKLVLRGDEARHAIRSLRLTEGEELMATDLAGTCYHAVLVRSEEVRKELIAECSLLQVLPEYHEPQQKIVLAQAILQQPSRFEEILEKATELGVTGFIPLICERTEKRQINRERLERILREATKQVSRARIPTLFEPMHLTDILSLSKTDGSKAIILHEAASTESRLLNYLNGVNSAIMVFIGPEGGFTENEIAHAQTQGAVIASLGERRLRAETAAVAAVSLVAFCK